MKIEGSWSERFIQHQQCFIYTPRGVYPPPQWPGHPLVNLLHTPLLAGCINFDLFITQNSALNLVSWFSGKSLKLLRPDVIFKAKMHQIQFLLGLRHRPRWRSLHRSPRPLRGTRKRGKEGKGKEDGGERVEGVGREGREGSPGSCLHPPNMKSWIKPWTPKVLCHCSCKAVCDFAGPYSDVLIVISVSVCMCCVCHRLFDIWSCCCPVIRSWPTTCQRFFRQRWMFLPSTVTACSRLILAVMNSRETSTVTQMRAGCFYFHFPFYIGFPVTCSQG